MLLLDDGLIKGLLGLLMMVGGAIAMVIVLIRAALTIGVRDDDDDDTPPAPIPVPQQPVALTEKTPGPASHS